VSEAPFDTHGRIKCGTIATPAFDRSLADYTGSLGLTVIEEGRVPADLAALWGAPACAGRRYALLHGGGRPGYLRLVENDAVTGYRPLTTLGWAAFEVSVAGVFDLHARLQGSAFDVIGAPKLVGDFANFIPFQVAGRAGEVLFLNQVLSESVDGIHLPMATTPIDQMFIAVLATDDRAAALAFHVSALGFEEGATYSFPYTVINDAFDLPADHPTTLTMTRVGTVAASEIDQYPPGTAPRPVPAGGLPPGNAMVSFIVRSLDAVRAPFVAERVRLGGPLYADRRVACVRGRMGELIELIEAAA